MNISWKPDDPNELDQFLICYRQKAANGLIDLKKKDVPNRLYYSEVKLPNKASNTEIYDWTAKEFTEKVTASLGKIENPNNENNEKRDQVMVYMHGYDLTSKLKLKLFSAYVRNYIIQSNNRIAKVIFFTWPSQGWVARKYVDDRTLDFGHRFVSNDLFNDLKVLSDTLKGEGYQLNLMVHSFGHQLLNGILNPTKKEYEKNIYKGIFNKVFLMAPDVSRMVLNKGGYKIKNYYDDDPDDNVNEFKYDYSNLKKLGNQTYVFYDKNDYLLYISTKKFIGKRRINNADHKRRMEFSQIYGNLGNYGSGSIGGDDPFQLQSGFEFRNIQKLIDADFDCSSKFPFQRMRRKFKEQINKVWSSYVYRKIRGGIFRIMRMTNHHRYLFTSEDVVREVQKTF